MLSAAAVAGQAAVAEAKGNHADAASLFEQAARDFDNELLSGERFLSAGRAYALSGDMTSAKEMFELVKTNKTQRFQQEADRLMAQGINIVAGLYKDGILEKPEGYAYAYPDLLTFHDAATVVEQKLFVMFLKHRMRTFQGAFHANPDYALWYGWSEMRMDLAEIKELAEQMHLSHSSK